jgi:hypothetical protein
MREACELASQVAGQVASQVASRRNISTLLNIALLRMVWSPTLLHVWLRPGPLCGSSREMTMSSTSG